MTLHKLLQRKSPEERNFKRWHISRYQGSLKKEAKRLFSEIWNSDTFTKELPGDTVELERIGLHFQGSILSLYHNTKNKKVEVDSTLEVYHTENGEVLIIKATRRRHLSLATLAAEKICESLDSSQQDLSELVRVSGIPAVCGEIISESL